MKLLVHICCAPCFIAPYFHLKEKGYEIHGFWYNHNIHPYTEYKKRLETLQEFAEKESINLIIKDEYELEKFLRKSAFREQERCRSCYFSVLNIFCRWIIIGSNHNYFFSIFFHFLVGFHILHIYLNRHYISRHVTRLF